MRVLAHVQWFDLHTNGLKRTLSLKQKVILPPAMLLAGGLGTRLRTAFASGPKCMAPIAGRPFLYYLLHRLRSEGVEEVILCVGYKKSHIRTYVGTGRKWGLRVRYSPERQLLGTGGALRHALHLLSADRMFVLNGDSFLDLNLRTLLEFHTNHRALATVGAVGVENTSRYGTLKLDNKGRIIAFLEKPEREKDEARESGKQVINGGIYVFEKELLKRL